VKVLKNLVSASWLWQRIDDEDVVIIDCRFDITNPGYGKEAFKQGHLKNSIFFEMDTDLSGPPEKHGGARPLPDLFQLASKLDKAGITKETTVISYDDQLNASARFWWLLKYIGHNRCYLLDGGIKGWMAQGYPVTTTKAPARSPGQVIIRVNEEMYCDIEYVKEKKDLPNVVLIDGREYERYTGEVEKLYKKAGHIPGAVSHHFIKDFNKGFLKKEEELSELWSWIKQDEEIILSCGSGIAASVSYLVLDELGRSAKLYVGGFSDWISYEDNPVEKDSKLGKVIRIIE
jgi:thiosulfate/3-mercaptopyruvate sulfurtransferase